jgi:hypothetical protein
MKTSSASMTISERMTSTVRPEFAPTWISVPMQVECDAPSLPAVTCTTKGRRFGVRPPKNFFRAA